MLLRYGQLLHFAAAVATVAAAVAAEWQTVAYFKL